MNAMSSPWFLLASAAIFCILQIIILRWVFRVDDIVFYLDKINEKLYRMEKERKKEQVEKV
ncbi:hypothetical protein [Chitinophaga sp. Cy-1792]|uniref:hypothetical protein n=1 Tax=Chitinophaga sp. Cy-1792 TaxID=2608339 RepID=UPI00141F41DC|nr:hypothetical protein [Chitinophaga sp. Cy-1792]NIG53815.1 hypothetical protein [Chitinophaga sp. Cy-1792]